MQTYNTLFRNLVAATLALSAFTFGQSTKRNSPGPLDADIVIPTTSGVLGQKDAGALTELASHRTAVGSNPWIGMQGTGTITYATQDSPAYDATLSNLSADRFRLDAQTTKGETSIRINGTVGKIQGSDGKISIIPSDTASLKLFAFELPRALDFSGPKVSLLDRGIVSVGDTRLHRITFEFPSSIRNPVDKLQQTNVIDLYLDPESHLLIKSASLILLADSRPTRFLSVVTYSDYRKVGASLIPFRYSETLEGQQCRTLQLSDVQLNPTLNSTYFDF
jgi:hypothetical protein